MTAKIVCLDGYTLNPGDISWECFEVLGELAVHDRTPAQQIVSRASGAPYVLTNKTPLMAETLEQLPDLKYIGVLATGYNVVDTDVAKRKGIVVTNVPTYVSDGVAQHATALMLELVRHVAVHSQAVREGKWTTNPDWCFALKPIWELSGRTLGVVGIGRIGRCMASIGQAMGMHVIAYDAYWPKPEQLEGLAVESVELNDLFRRSDVISLHCPLTPETDRLVNAERLATMKSTAIVVNTSRGPLIDNQALADALQCGTIAGAGLDVLDEEPPPADNPLLAAPNCFITPHISWYAPEARERLMQTAAGNLRAFIAGQPVNVVN